MTQEKLLELRSGFETAYIDGTVASNLAYKSQFISNNYKQGKKFFSKKYWKYALKFNIPLIPYYLSQVVFNTSDRIMISYIPFQY